MARSSNSLIYILSVDLIWIGTSSFGCVPIHIASFPMIIDVSLLSVSDTPSRTRFAGDVVTGLSTDNTRVRHYPSSVRQLDRSYLYISSQPVRLAAILRQRLGLTSGGWRQSAERLLELVVWGIWKKCRAASRTDSGKCSFHFIHNTFHYRLSSIASRENTAAKKRSKPTAEA